MDVEKYLARINCTAPCPPTLDTLRLVHLNHLLSVPFENLTVHMGERVRLELPLLYEKIVIKRRGGFCFENNGLFSWLLTQMGFDVTLLSAQVRNRLTCAYGPPFDHVIMMVKLDGQRWLCDVGFGGGFQLPLSLETNSSQVQSHGVYRLRFEGNLIFMEVKSEVSENGEESWTEQYKFTLEPRDIEDFRAMCDYHQSSANSIIFCKSLFSQLLPTGRVTVLGRRLITTSLTSEDGQPATKTTRDHLSDEEISELLREKFGVVLSSPLIIKDEEIVPPPVTY